MRILFLSFYYEPDLSAGSFRATALVKALRQTLPPESHIDLLTTVPNRYSSFNIAAQSVEDQGVVTVRRILLPAHKSGMHDQSKAFLAYAREVRAYVKDKKYDLVFATSSRLMTAVLGAYIARYHKVPLYLDIRDIFVDTIQDILPSWLAWPIGRTFALLERYAIGYASKVNLVSPGFEQYFSLRYPRQKFSFYSNGVDDQFNVSFGATESETNSEPPYKVLYAGNIGEGQGLHAILPGLARAMRGQANFTVIGDGGRKEQLQSELEKSSVDNVVLCEPANRSSLVQAYLEADVLFLHLNDHDAFRKVVPSKVFEYAATGKPIWAGVAGYSADFFTQEIHNCAVFPPCNVAAAMDAFTRLQIRSAPRLDFVQKYQRTRIVQKLAEDIIKVGLKVQ